VRLAIPSSPRKSGAVDEQRQGYREEMDG